MNPDEGTARDGRDRGAQSGFLSRLRGHFLTGVVVTAPIVLTGYIVWVVVGFVDQTMTGLVPARYNPSNYLPFKLPGLGLLMLLVLFPLVGYLARGLFGRWIMRQGESFLARLPVVRSVYGALKQIFETVLAHQATAFREVVLIEYPRRGVWALGFVSSRTAGEVQNLTEQDMVNVFLPTTPNPTSGFLLFLPRRDVITLHMSIEEGLKMVISGGLVTPKDPRPPEQREIKVFAGGKLEASQPERK